MIVQIVSVISARRTTHVGLAVGGVLSMIVD